MPPAPFLLSRRDPEGKGAADAGLSSGEERYDKKGKGNSVTPSLPSGGGSRPALKPVENGSQRCSCKKQSPSPAGMSKGRLIPAFSHSRS